MTVVEVYRQNGIPLKLKVTGHSGYAQEGSDVVCAAVSVLVQTLHIGLADILGQNVDSHVDEERAVIELSWKDDGSRELRVLTETIARTLCETAQSYGSYVKYVEVPYNAFQGN
ncbi:MAG: ribosomal-processing cysteine protease Prp [Pyramidobacter sp.]|nr:ribosomal-processing cysteine protease Prp [Pyramidobacter sp.]